MLQIIKSYTMPIAMLLGMFMYSFFSQFASIIPYFIFLMLFFTFLKIDWHEIRFRRMHVWLLFIQVFGAVAVYFSLKSINPILAQGASICVLAPTATAAPVIARMLNGNVESLTAYSLLSNLLFLILAPIFFGYIGESNIPFIHSFFTILQKVSILLLLPMVLAALIRFANKRFAANVAKLGFLSFYLWAVSLTIVVARTVQFMLQQKDGDYSLWIYLALSTLVIGILQFVVGRRIGRKYNDTVAGGQGLGQKNTVLIIWMAQSFLNPISSIGAGAYVIWQNSINSFQIWKENNRKLTP